VVVAVDGPCPLELESPAVVLIVAGSPPEPPVPLGVAIVTLPAHPASVVKARIEGILREIKVSMAVLREGRSPIERRSRDPGR
jgi:hypothetical protein